MRSLSPASVDRIAAIGLGGGSLLLQLLFLLLMLV